jgi:SsrA-binding protein
MSSKNEKEKSPTEKTIALNRKARHEYTIEDKFEAGMVLEGWEIKSIRAGKASIADSYVIIKNGEAWLLGSCITPLSSASTHKVTSPERTKKLLLHKAQLQKLIGAKERQGYTIVALKLYWRNNRVKLEIGLAKGKQLHDKRQTIKDREWAVDKQRLAKMTRR